MITRRTLLACALGAAALVACGDDGDSSGSGGITVTGAWARTSPAAVTAGAAYMTITSEKADALVRASVASSIAGRVEIHEVVMAETDMTETTMGDMTETTMGDMGGEMTMRPIARLELPAGTPVELKPGGYHIMMLELAAPLETGKKFELTLTFESGTEKKVEVEVREDAP